MQAQTELKLFSNHKVKLFRHVTGIMWMSVTVLNPSTNFLLNFKGQPPLYIVLTPDLTLVFQFNSNFSYNGKDCLHQGAPPNIAIIFHELQTMMLLQRALASHNLRFK